MTDYVQQFSDYYQSFVNWFERNMYRLKKNYRVYKDYFKENLSIYGKAYGKYALFEVIPFMAAYGLMLNFPVSVLLGWSLTVETVVAWGLVFYFVSEELTSIANELKPYIRVSAKVDN